MSPPVRFCRLDRGLGRGCLSEPLHILAMVRTPERPHVHLPFGLVVSSGPRSAPHGLIDRTGEAGGRECHCARRHPPGHNLDEEPTGADPRVLFFERAGLLGIDIEDAQSSVHVVGQWSRRKEVTSLVEIGDMRHVGVLQRRTGLLVKLWSVSAQHEQRDGELVELHVSMLNVALRPDAVWSRGTQKAPESTGPTSGCEREICPYASPTAQWSIYQKEAPSCRTQPEAPPTDQWSYGLMFWL